MAVLEPQDCTEHEDCPIMAYYCDGDLQKCTPCSELCGITADKISKNTIPCVTNKCTDYLAYIVNKLQYSVEEVDENNVSTYVAQTTTGTMFFSNDAPSTTNHDVKNIIEEQDLSSVSVHDFAVTAVVVAIVVFVVAVICCVKHIRKRRGRRSDKEKLSKCDPATQDDESSEELLSSSTTFITDGTPTGNGSYSQSTRTTTNSSVNTSDISIAIDDEVSGSSNECNHSVVSPSADLSTMQEADGRTQRNDGPTYAGGQPKKQYPKEISIVRPQPRVLDEDPNESEPKQVVRPNDPDQSTWQNRDRPSSGGQRDIDPTPALEFDLGKFAASTDPEEPTGETASPLEPSSLGAGNYAARRLAGPVPPTDDTEQGGGGIILDGPLNPEGIDNPRGCISVTELNNLYSGPRYSTENELNEFHVHRQTNDQSRQEFNVNRTSPLESGMSSNVVPSFIANGRSLGNAESPESDIIPATNNNHNHT